MKTDTAAALVFPTNIADRGTWFAGREAFPG
jgi:hypothetical protein